MSEVETRRRGRIRVRRFVPAFARRPYRDSRPARRVRIEWRWLCVVVHVLPLVIAVAWLAVLVGAFAAAGTSVGVLVAFCVAAGVLATPALRGVVNRTVIVADASELKVNSGPLFGGKLCLASNDIADFELVRVRSAGARTALPYRIDLHARMFSGETTVLGRDLEVYEGPLLQAELRQVLGIRTA